MGFHLEFTCADEHIVMSATAASAPVPGALENVLFMGQFGRLRPVQIGARLLKFVKGDPNAFFESSILAHDFPGLRGTRSSVRSWSRLSDPAPFPRDLHYVLDHGN